MNSEQKFKTKRLDKIQSGFGQYFIVIALILVICCTAFVLLMFRTNILLNVDEIVQNSVIHVRPSATSVSVSSQLMDDNLGEQTSSAQSPTGDFDQSVYDKLIAAKFSEAKSVAMTYAYSTFAPLYGTETAIGIMANVQAEGTLGAVEDSFARLHAHGFSLPSGKTIVSSQADVEYLKSWDSSSSAIDHGVKKGSCGFGMAQMSWGRRVKLCDFYLQYVTDYNDLKSMAYAEIAHMGSELEDGGAYNSVVKHCSGKSATEAARVVCLEYEVPANRYVAAVIRSGYAARIQQILSN